MKMQPSRRALLAAIVFALCSRPSRALVLAQDAPAEVSVYLLAGQSNMEGQAVVDLDHPQHYNGGRGILRSVLDEGRAEGRWSMLRKPDGSWAERDDVWCWYRSGHGELKAGPLSIGFAVYGGRHHFGPELMLGHALGELHEEPVLLVKTAWGGKSLMRDFRPPSAGGESGPYYARMLEEYRAGVQGALERFEGLRERRPVLRGVVWFQGWNDMVDAEASASYADNLEHLIGDLRAEFGQAQLPFVVGETGNCNDLEFRAAQREGCERAEFTRFVPTADFLLPAEDSPNTGHGHHWYGNAESYLRIGEALGAAMSALVRPGDSADSSPR